MRARERDPLLLLRVKRRRRRRHSVCQTQNAERRNIDGGFSEVLYSVGRARLTLPFVPTAGSLGCAGGGGSTTCVGVMTYATKHYCDLVVL